MKIGDLTLCTIRVIQTQHVDYMDDPIVSPTQPWIEDDEDIEFDYLQDASRTGFLHVVEYLCQDDSPRQVVKVLLLQQDGSSEWSQGANLDRLGSIPAYRSPDQDFYFFKCNRDACHQLLGIHVVMAIQGQYDPLHSNKWILLAGGSSLRWCKICQAPRTVTPSQCDALLGQQCHITMRNLVTCRPDEPLMLINGDVLWSDTRVHDVASIAFGGTDRLADRPNDEILARLMQFNLEPGSLAIDEVVFHFDILQVLQPGICWCAPGSWVNNESQFRLPTEPVDLQRCYQHFVVPILVVFDWIFVEVRFFEGRRLVSEPGFVSFPNLDSSRFGTWSGKWFLGSGFWQVVSGKWFLGSGFWEVVSGKWFLGSGFREVVSGGCFLGSGFWEVVSGGWFLGSGFWEVVSGKWFLASGFWEVVSGKWLPGSGFREVVSGEWFLGSGFWGLVSGKWFLGAGFWEVVSGGWFLGSGFWEVVSGGWFLGSGFGGWFLGSGCWEVVWFLGSGFWEVVWFLGSGFWEVVSGKWFLGSGFWEVVSGKWFWRLVSGDWFLGSGFWGLVSEKRSFFQGVVVKA